jgi:hypothetical protein
MLVAADRDLSACDAQACDPRSTAYPGEWAAGLNRCRLIRNGPSRFELLPPPFNSVGGALDSYSDDARIGFPTLCQQKLQCP